MEICSKMATKPCFLFCLIIWLVYLLALAIAEVHYHEFDIQAKPIRRLCHTSTTITVNGRFPGPTLRVRNGDSLVVKVVNQVKYNVTIHWHGIGQRRNGWADGAAYVTQCPIQPGGIYTYKFNIEDQEGTLWWHAHSSWLRATVYGALIILPKEPSSYPFTRPHREFPIILGEWWNKNPISIIRQALKTGAAPKVSDAFTINGRPGDLAQCSNHYNRSTRRTTSTILHVIAGETLLFRIINAAMDSELFFAVADHTMTVVAADASYTKPFKTSVILLGPGQTTDVLVQANQPVGRYYLAARAYVSGPITFPFDKTMATAILHYSQNLNSNPPRKAVLPAYNDRSTAATFSAGLKSPGCVDLPGPVDDHLFITVGLGLFKCPTNKRCGGPNGTIFTASMNNNSFVLPNKLSLLEAVHSGVPDLFTADFPAFPLRFDYTGNNLSRELFQPIRSTKLYPLKYGSVVQIVLQGTNIFAAEEHPMHIHGYEFYVLGRGKGNFDEIKDGEKLNLVDPPKRNTIGVPVNGWAVIRFRADNPGVWHMHCHIETHLTWGLATALLVENGANESESTLPPPPDLPRC